MTTRETSANRSQATLVATASHAVITNSLPTGVTWGISAGTAMISTGRTAAHPANMPTSAEAVCGLPPEPALLMSAATGNTADMSAATGVIVT